ncbi:hypothetical protein RirG_031710 [Rhizophagus irregularis DAOM 197198w]|uniref:Uncharacterized protein n=1 Tax=Rhizophagus irregularis (strain DAOM 197198w) TaxID=1432141 RepID=A0A015KAI9_RHIIW|nr:hypothetical protein RirG_031710 [Rhizophagus irregularis DAOM 197198w]
MHVLVACFFSSEAKAQHQRPRHLPAVYSTEKKHFWMKSNAGMRSNRPIEGADRGAGAADPHHRPLWESRLTAETWRRANAKHDDCGLSYRRVLCLQKGR